MRSIPRLNGSLPVATVLLVASGLAQAADQCPDEYGDAPDTFEDACLVSDGVGYTGQVTTYAGCTSPCPPPDLTADYYKFVVAAGQDIVVEGSFPSGAPAQYVHFRLYDPNNFQRDSADFGTADSTVHTLHRADATAGEWRIAFVPQSYGSNGQIRDYNFLITLRDAPSSGGGGGGSLPVELVLATLLAFFRRKRPDLSSQVR